MAKSMQSEGTGGFNSAEWVSQGLKILRRYKSGQILNLADIQAKLVKSGLSTPPTGRHWGPLVAKAQREGILANTGESTRINGRMVRVFELRG